MSEGKSFFDTNVLLYLQSADAAKADRAEELIAGGGVISVQVLNEFVAVAVRKLGMKLAEIREILSVVRSLCAVEPLTVATHELALDLAGRFRLSFYDALIVAAASLADCAVVYSEDMRDGQTIAGVTIRNPFSGD
jgi:predicted nucleic acid-binding protein